jgi:hypothetical protein
MGTVYGRIVKRYKENFQYLVKQISNIVSPTSSTDAKDKMNNLFGFKKVFLMLSDVGRLVALSATDGSI